MTLSGLGHSQNALGLGIVLGAIGALLRYRIGSSSFHGDNGARSMILKPVRFSST
jgi:hypothetical protein